MIKSIYERPFKPKEKQVFDTEYIPVVSLSFY